MGDSSAGRFWSQSAIAYFAHHENRPIWIIRTWWGRRVIVDLTRARFLDPSAMDEDCARSIEISHIDAALKGGVEKLGDGKRLAAEEDQKDAGGVRALMAAAYHAGWLEAKSTVPFLRRLEALGTSHKSVWIGPVGWASVAVLAMRQVAKLSLLRLGEEPSWLPHYEFRCRDNVPDKIEPRATAFLLPESPPARHPELLEAGLTQMETLRRIGAPDFILRANRCDHWEYDFCSPSRTLRIMWDDSHLRDLPREEYKRMITENPPRMGQPEVLEPQWKRISMRDRLVT
jgi:hypothetical protein